MLMPLRRSLAPAFLSDWLCRVLAAALAYRLWRTQGTLPRYEDGDNAVRIQHVGIPGLTVARS